MPEQPPSAAQPQAYDFIINPEKPPTKRTLLPGGNSLLMRVVVVAAGFIILIVAFNVIKALVSGPSNLPSMVTVAQDQQELIHIATAANQQQSNLSISNKNFVATAQISLTSAQSQLLTYLKTNGKKVSPKILNLKISTTTDAQLAASQTAATYDQTLHDIMKTKLTSYKNDLRHSYQLTKGKKGRALLSSDYDQAQLLLVQLDSPAS